MKICGKCDRPRETKHAWCKACQSAYNKAHYRANAEVNRLKTRQWAVANPEKVRANNAKRDKEAMRLAVAEYRKKNPEKMRQQYASYAKRNPDKRAALEAKRRLIHKRATPKWANRFFMADAYELAQLRTKATGYQWVVD